VRFVESLLFLVELPGTMDRSAGVRARSAVRTPRSFVGRDRSPGSAADGDAHALKAGSREATCSWLNCAVNVNRGFLLLLLILIVISCRRVRLGLRARLGAALGSWEAALASSAACADNRLIRGTISITELGCGRGRPRSERQVRRKSTGAVGLTPCVFLRRRKAEAWGGKRKPDLLRSGFP
jgi:hypothetical protein